MAGLLDIEAPPGGGARAVALAVPPRAADAGPGAGRAADVGDPRASLTRVAPDVRGRPVETWHRRRIGQPAARTTSIASEVDKQGRSGPLRFVTVRHEIVQASRVGILVEHDIVYRAPGGTGLQTTDSRPSRPIASPG